MDAFMDTLWNKIMIIIASGVSMLDHLLAPLHVFGPVFVLTVLAFLTVLVTKILNRVIITKRFVELEKEFKHWAKIREEAMKGDDLEKAKRLARNIDQAKLNRVYYDYFLEGFLLGLVRNVLPILMMLAYVNQSYPADKLISLSGRGYLFSLPSISGQPILVGSVFFFVMALLAIYLVWYMVKKKFEKGPRRSNHPIRSSATDIV